MPPLEQSKLNAGAQNFKTEHNNPGTVKNEFGITKLKN
jgi:hypothetical protein